MPPASTGAVVVLQAAADVVLAWRRDVGRVERGHELPVGQQFERVALVELEGIVGLRFDIDAHDVKACATVAHCSPPRPQNRSSSRGLMLHLRQVRRW